MNQLHKITEDGLNCARCGAAITRVESEMFSGSCVECGQIKSSQALRSLSLGAYEAALGWKLMYRVCGERRQFWAWCDELELAFVFAERARVEEAGMVLLPEWAESLNEPHTGECKYCDRWCLVNAFWMCESCALEAEPAIPDEWYHLPY